MFSTQINTARKASFGWGAPHPPSFCLPKWTMVSLTCSFSVCFCIL